MPELPEVETIKRTLEPKLKGLSFQAVEVYLPKIIRTPVPQEFIASIPGKTIQKIERRGKYLLFFLAENFVLVLHLRMTGRLIYSAPEDPLGPHTHIIFHLDNGFALRYMDTRQFGRVFLVKSEKLPLVAGLNSLGIEPFDPGFTKAFLIRELKRRHTKIKSLLIDQSFIAGIGNIYADEVLFRALIHPQRQSQTLTIREATRLYYAIREILKEGIENRGASIKDYVNGEGNAGNYQNLLKVYGHEGKPCTRCSRPIAKIYLGGRSTHFCSTCQK